MKQLLDILAGIASTLEEIRRQGSDPDESMTTEEVAVFLKVHPDEVLRYVKLGLRHYVGMGKGFRFVKRDVTEWREQYRREQSAIKRSRRAA